MGLGQYNCLGKYCGPHTASYVFLILILYLECRVIPGEGDSSPQDGEGGEHGLQGCEDQEEPGVEGCKAELIRLRSKQGEVVK